MRSEDRAPFCGDDVQGDLQCHGGRMHSHHRKVVTAFRYLDEEVPIQVKPQAPRGELPIASRRTVRRPESAQRCAMCQGVPPGPNAG